MRENDQLYYDLLLAADWLLSENRETEALAAVNHFNITRVNEVIAIFTRFTKCVERNFFIF